MAQSDITMPSVQIIVLNWNGRDYLEQCLSALTQLDYPRYQVQVVDNGSTDGSLELVRERFPQFDVIENSRNLGFAAGNNVALRNLNPDIVVLLNPDVVVSPEWLLRLVTVFAEDPTIGITGGKLWYPDGRTIQHAGGYLTLPQAMPGHYGVGEVDSGQYDQMRDVDYVIGGAMAIRNQVFDQIGLLDEGFFLYFEDADFCARAREAGWRVIYTPLATAIHVESATAVKGSFAYLERFHAGRWRYLLKHYLFPALLDETAAAERDWLSRIDPRERRAAALSYTSVLGQLYPGQVTLAGELSGAAESSAMGQLRQLLLELRILAWATDESRSPSILHQLAEVKESEFKSNLPLIGPLIVAFRSAWSQVAARWYVRPMLEQQNQFNHLLVESLETTESQFAQRLQRLHQLEANMASQQAERHQLLRDVTELEEAIRTAQKQLASTEKGRD